MEKSRQSLIRSYKQEQEDYLERLDVIDDLDLYEEMSAKMNDVLLTYAEGQRKETANRDEQIRQMAFTHAVNEVFPELDEAGEWPTFLMRGESGA